MNVLNAFIFEDTSGKETNEKTDDNKLYVESLKSKNHVMRDKKIISNHIIFILS